MAKLIVSGNFTKITEESDIQFLLELDKHLSFFVQGAEHMPAYKGYFNHNGDWVKWDGQRKLLTAALNFATGLLNRVKEFYKLHGKDVEIIDKRPPKSIAPEINIIDNLKKINIIPYQYQLDVLSVIEKEDRGIIKSATGSGKSAIAALITAKLGKKTIIYVIGKDLLYQFHKFFEKAFDTKIGIVGDGHCDIQNINIVSIWTAGQAIGLDKKDILLEDDGDEEKLEKNKYVQIAKLLKETKVHIIDECHQAAAETFQQLYKNITPEYIYGLSGSPWRDDNADLLIESILGNYIVNISASQLIKEGYLAQPIIRFRAVPKYPEKLKFQYNHVYKNYIIENEIRNNLILESAKSMLAKGYQTLVLFSSIKHGKILYKLFSKEIDCVILDGSADNETRNKVKEDVLSGKVQCVLASRIFDIGVDLPSLSGLVIGSAGKSTVKALQRVGRVIRRYKNKKFAAVIDFYDQAPFLTQHSEIRYKIYKSEDGFDVKWPLDK